MQKGLTPEQLSSQPEHQQKLAAFLQAHGKTATDYAYLPLVGKEKDVVWVWDKAAEQPVGTLDIDPWRLSTHVATSVARPSLSNEWLLFPIH